MPDPTLSKPKHINAVRSAGEQTSSKGPEATWQFEGGHMSSTCGRIVSTPEGELPYKVILSHERSVDTEHAFASMREAEAFIRRNTPRPAARRTLMDRDAPNG